MHSISSWTRRQVCISSKVENRWEKQLFTLFLSDLKWLQFPNTLNPCIPEKGKTQKPSWDKRWRQHSSCISITSRMAREGNQLLSQKTQMLLLLQRPAPSTKQLFSLPRVVSGLEEEAPLRQWVEVQWLYCQGCLNTAHLELLDFYTTLRL